MHSSVAEIEPLCTTHVPKSASFVNELQLPNKGPTSVDLGVYTEATAGSRAYEYNGDAYRGYMCVTCGRGDLPYATDPFGNGENASPI